MKVITSYKGLEVRKYYFCKRKGTSDVKIYRVSGVAGTGDKKYLGPDRLFCDNRIWNSKNNNKIFDNYDVLGPIEVPNF
jgi:hypothetical protein